jgi:signal transduction histidine kinase
MRSALDLARMRREVAAHQTRETGLAESLRLRDEFLAVASHELKTPLTPLKLHLHAIQKAAGRRGSELTATELGPKLERMARQVHRLEELVNNLLDSARLATQRVDIASHDVDLAQLVREVAERFAADKRSSVELSLPPRLLGRWNRPRVEQIAHHLIANAMKFGAGGRVTIDVAADGGWARMIVRDRGIGVASEDQIRIFQRFERAVSPDHYGGLGLGLWIVRQIVEGLGGAITIESSLGKGSAFTVKLPLTPPAN